MGSLVPNLDALLKELAADSPARELAATFAQGDDIERVRGQLRAVVARWLQEEEAEGGGATVPSA